MVTEQPATIAPRFFAGPDDFRAWFDAHHETATELLVGFYKKGSGKPSIIWPEAVDEALRVGWIDGVRRSLGAESYTIRFTPRKPRSIWSAVNIKRVQELQALGRMHAAGLGAFERRSAEKSAIYAYEQHHPSSLDAEQERRFRANHAAWAWFQAQPTGYRKTAIWWVVIAKKVETRLKRLATLIDCSARERKLDHLTWQRSPGGRAGRTAGDRAE